MYIKVLFFVSKGKGPIFKQRLGVRGWEGMVGRGGDGRREEGRGGKVRGEEKRE